MSILTNRVLGIAALDCLLGASCVEGAVQASFHLPFATYWGRTLLRPGDYKIKVLGLNIGPSQVMIQGEGKTISVMIQSEDAEVQNSHSSLQLVEKDGAYFIKEYRSSVAGKTYSFG